MWFDNVRRLLVLAAHPDDETIGCGCLLQRVPCSLVVFAVDGAPAGYGFERQFGGLKNYSEERFREAGRALGRLPNCSFQRLKTQRQEYFRDRHLFEQLEEAAASLRAITKEFSPDAIVSHAFEGGHVDHDACSVLAKHAASTFALQEFEFPLYWQKEPGQDVFQEFRYGEEGEMELTLAEAEIETKKKMLAEYRTQQNLVAVFSTRREKFRPLPLYDYTRPSWKLIYPGNWLKRPAARAVKRRFAEFLERTNGRVRGGAGIELANRA
jgi:N-acetylglucosamine malate deacetylase 2